MNAKELARIMKSFEQRMKEMRQDLDNIYREAKTRNIHKKIMNQK